MNTVILTTQFIRGCRQNGLSDEQISEISISIDANKENHFEGITLRGHKMQYTRWKEYTITFSINNVVSTITLLNIFVLPPFPSKPSKTNFLKKLLEKLILAKIVRDLMDAQDKFPDIFGKYISNSNENILQLKKLPSTIIFKYVSSKKNTTQSNLFHYWKAIKNKKNFIFNSIYVDHAEKINSIINSVRFILSKNHEYFESIDAHINMGIVISELTNIVSDNIFNDTCTAYIDILSQNYIRSHSYGAAQPAIYQTHSFGSRYRLAHLCFPIKDSTPFPPRFNRYDNCECKGSCCVIGTALGGRSTLELYWANYAFRATNRHSQVDYIIPADIDEISNNFDENERASQQTYCAGRDFFCDAHVTPVPLRASVHYLLSTRRFSEVPNNRLTSRLNNTDKTVPGNSYDENGNLIRSLDKYTHDFGYDASNLLAWRKNFYFSADAIALRHSCTYSHRGLWNCWANSVYDVFKFINRHRQGDHLTPRRFGNIIDYDSDNRLASLFYETREATTFAYGANCTYTQFEYDTSGCVAYHINHYCFVAQACQLNQRSAHTTHRYSFDVLSNVKDHLNDSTFDGDAIWRSSSYSSSVFLLCWANSMRSVFGYHNSHNSYALDYGYDVSNCLAYHACSLVSESWLAHVCLANQHSMSSPTRYIRYDNSDRVRGHPEIFPIDTSAIERSSIYSHNVLRICWANTALNAFKCKNTHSQVGKFAPCYFDDFIDYDYDGNNHLAGTDSLQQITSYHYDTSRQVLKVSVPIPVTEQQNPTFSYDERGNLMKIVEDEWRAAEFTYHANGSQLAKIDVLTNCLSRTIGANGRVIGETQTLADGTTLTMRYVYDANSHLRFIISADGRVEEFRYGESGARTVSITYPQGTSTPVAEKLREWQMLGWVEQQDKTQSERTDYAYDDRGRLKSTTVYATLNSADEGVVDAQASVIHNACGMIDQLIQSIGAVGDSTQYTYDVFGRILSRKNALGQTTLYHYDDAGRQNTITLANGLRTSSLYDLVRRLIAQRQSNASLEVLSETYYVYDANNRLHLASRLNYTSEAITFAYGVNDRCVHDYEYDAEGKRATRVILRYNYDALGNISRCLDSYNALGNLTSRQPMFFANAPEIGRSSVYSQNCLPLDWARSTYYFFRHDYRYDSDVNLNGNYTLALCYIESNLASIRATILDALLCNWAHVRPHKHRNLRAAPRYIYDVLNRLSRIFIADTDTAPLSSVYLRSGLRLAQVISIYDAFRYIQRHLQIQHFGRRRFAKFIENIYDCDNRLTNSFDTTSEVTKLTYDAHGNHTRDFEYDSSGYRIHQTSRRNLRYRTHVRVLKHRGRRDYEGKGNVKSCQRCFFSNTDTGGLLSTYPSNGLWLGWDTFFYDSKYEDAFDYIEAFSPRNEIFPHKNNGPQNKIFPLWNNSYVNNGMTCPRKFGGWRYES